MVDFKFLKNPITGKSVILAPRRAKRPNVEGANISTVCPFCIGGKGEDELYRVPGDSFDNDWKVWVIKNKFPFVPQHEIVVLSPDHHKSFDELPLSQIELIFQAYKQRYNANTKNGQPYIFHNGGLGSGESMPHPHSQIAVVPMEISSHIPQLEKINGKRQMDNGQLETDHFSLFCPKTSEWPDEVWIVPQENGQNFGSISDEEITDISFILSRLIQILDYRHGHEFAFNFYIFPGSNWYLRLIPRLKTLGGFEIGTQIMINTQDPYETFDFIKEHFWEPNLDKIKKEQQAEYIKSA